MTRLLLTIILAVFALAPLSAAAQIPLGAGGGGETEELEIPADLTPDQVDALLARLTDAEIRQLLAEELRQRADAMAAEEMTGGEAFEYVTMRLQEMSER
ncbi:MAG: hypothetical protein AAGF44_12340, partial [Pseudomonadota bacterium]